MAGKFLKGIKVFNACSTSSVNLDMQYVFFDNGNAYAADSSILVKVPLEMMTVDIPEEQLAHLNGRCIHASVLKTVYKYDDIYISEGLIEAKVGRHNITFDLLTAPGEIKRPDFEKIIQTVDVKTPVKELGLSSKYLSRIASAMGSKDIVKLSFTTANSKIFISDLSDSCGALGVIMPTLITPRLDGFE